MLKYNLGALSLFLALSIASKQWRQSGAFVMCNNYFFNLNNPPIKFSSQLCCMRVSSKNVVLGTFHTSSKNLTSTFRKQVLQGTYGHFSPLSSLVRIYNIFLDVPSEQHAGEVALSNIQFLHATCMNGMVHKRYIDVGRSKFILGDPFMISVLHSC